MFDHGMGPVYLRLMLEGLLLTLQISVGALVVGSLIACVLGPMRGSSRVWIRAPVAVYVNLLRSIPLLILLFLVYYGVPVFLGASIGVLTAAIIGQGACAGAYITEVVHSGLKAIPRGQYEAARALGLSYPRMMGHVIGPQALRIMLPAMVGLFVGNVKDSSIASIIGLQELTQTALNIRNLTFSTWDVFGFLVFFYLAVNFTITWAGGRLERRLDKSMGRLQREGRRLAWSSVFARRSI